MDVEAVDLHFILIDDLVDFLNLINRDAKLRTTMSRGNFEVANRHDVWIKTNATGVTGTVFCSEFFKYGKVIQVDVKTQFNALHNFVEVYAIWRVHNIDRCESCPQGDVRFLNGHDIYA